MFTNGSLTHSLIILKLISVHVAYRSEISIIYTYIHIHHMLIYAFILCNTINTLTFLLSVPQDEDFYI